MFTRFVESLLPGLRDARTPLASGVLWMLFGWMLLAPVIPRRADSTGLMRQVYDVTAAVGSGYAIAGVALLAYVLGILGVTAADIARNHVAWGWRKASFLLGRINWQRGARRRRRGLRKQLRDHARLLESATGTDREKQIRHQIDNDTKELSKLDSATILAGLWIKRTPETQRTVGSGRQTVTLYSVASKILYDAWEKGVDSELQRRDLNVGLYELSDNSIQSYDRLVDHELGPEPLDALQALDERLYQAFDRARAEREFRIAAMPPTIAIAIYVAMTGTSWALVAAGVATLTFVLASIRQSEEATRVLNLIVVKGLSLPSLAAAERGGRFAVRDHLAKRNAKAPVLSVPSAREGSTPPS